MKKIIVYLADILDGWLERAEDALDGMRSRLHVFAAPYRGYPGYTGSITPAAVKYREEFISAFEAEVARPKSSATDDV